MTILTMLAQAATGFDVERATSAYLNLLQGPARAKSDSYFQGGYWLILWNAAVAATAAAIILATGWSSRWRGWAERAAPRTWLVPALYTLPYTLTAALLTLPWTIYTGFLRERQYGLMNQGFGAWLGDQGKGLGIALVISAVVFAVIRRAPRT